jgi:hypothetical protein
MTEKFTSEELAGWMIGKISEVYFQGYRLAYDVCRKAQRAYCFELGLDDCDFIQFGYWDSLKKGLLAGDQLQLDLRRMEMAYLDANTREHELTKHVSLELLHPEALVELREQGACFVQLPESIFDLDHAGHYMRRIKSVSLTLPCTTGPYTTVSCKLTLLANRVRKSASATGQYGWNGPDDLRFRHDSGGAQSIVTSSGRDDPGLFQLDLHDERYLPFEGAGAVSLWRLELPPTFRQFDYSTISDVVMHVRYTARDGGSALRDAATNSLTSALKNLEVEPGTTGLFRLIMARSELPDPFHRLLHPLPSAPEQQLSFVLGKDRFPAHLRDKAIKISSLTVFMRLAEGVTYDTADPLVLTVQRPSGVSPVDVTLTVSPTESGGLPAGTAAFPAPGVALSPTNPWRIVIKSVPAALGEDVDVEGTIVTRLKPDAVKDVGIFCTYTF